MEINPGTIIVKNDIKNDAVDKQMDIKEGEQFEVVFLKESFIRVKRIKNDTYYSMYLKHFLDSNGNLIVECMWR